MKLTYAEAQEPLWAKLKEYFTRELEDIRLKNEALTVDDRQTAAYRGQIRLLKQIIDMDSAVRPKE